FFEEKLVFAKCGYQIVEPHRVSIIFGKEWLTNPIGIASLDESQDKNPFTTDLFDSQYFYLTWICRHNWSSCCTNHTAYLVECTTVYPKSFFQCTGKIILCTSVSG